MNLILKYIILNNIKMSCNDMALFIGLSKQNNFIKIKLREIVIEYPEYKNIIDSYPYIDYIYTNLYQLWLHTQNRHLMFLIIQKLIEEGMYPCLHKEYSSPIHCAFVTPCDQSILTKHGVNKQSKKNQKYRRLHLNLITRKSKNVYDIRQTRAQNSMNSYILSKRIPDEITNIIVSYHRYNYNKQRKM